MDDFSKPIRPRRRAVAIYLTPDERECIDAARGSMPRGPFMRASTLFRAGWQGYSGPMFDRTQADIAQRVELAQVADILHETVRTLDEAAATACALTKEGDGPGPMLCALIVKLCALIRSQPAQLGPLRAFEDTALQAFNIEAASTKIANGIVAAELATTAELLLLELGKQEEADHG